MKKTTLTLLVCLMQIGLSAQDTVMIGKYKRFESKILGGTVTYLEHLPEDYNNSNKEYPVTYMMNGHIIPDFANAVSSFDNLSGDRIPDMILIGISNTGNARFHWSCPNDTGYVNGGELFHKFLEKELIPEINKNYRTNDYKILAGQSNASLFVLYNFLFYPDLFNAYIVASPMLKFCPEFFLNKTKSFLKDNPTINKKLYISYGDLDYVEVLSHINELKELFNRSPESLKWKFDIIENAGHVPFATFNNALLFFFSECTLNAERKKLTISEIKSHFEKLSKEYGFSVYPKAGVLFDLAIDLKNEKKFDEAIEKFKYLISLYNNSETYYYFFGETYQQKGEIELAKKMFNESLKINPDYRPAKAALEKFSK